MEILERVNDLAKRAQRQLAHLNTEEATKTALVMPLLQILGYNIFDPTEIIPEYTADVGTKKGEKVDYAICRDGKPVVLMECKKHGSQLDIEKSSQLYRYFSVTEAKFAVLTDGLKYRIFTDIDQPNKMDSKPFLEFSILDMTQGIAEELKKFAKERFNVDTILSTASNLKYTKGVKRAFAEEFANPSEEFVRLLASRVYAGRFTQALRDQFTPIVKSALQEFVHDRVNERLKLALEPQSTVESGTVQSGSVSEVADEDETSGIVTTEEEKEAFMIVRAILRESVDPKRVFIRDSKSYCSVILDDNNRKPICRFYFNAAKQKYLGLFGEDKEVTRNAMADLSDIYGHAGALRQAAARYAQAQ